MTSSSQALQSTTDKLPSSNSTTGAGGDEGQSEDKTGGRCCYSRAFAHIVELINRGASMIKAQSYQEGIQVTTSSLGACKRAMVDLPSPTTSSRTDGTGQSRQRNDGGRETRNRPSLFPVLGLEKLVTNSLVGRGAPWTLATEGEIGACINLVAADTIGTSHCRTTAGASNTHCQPITLPSETVDFKNQGDELDQTFTVLSIVALFNLALAHHLDARSMPNVACSDNGCSRLGSDARRERLSIEHCCSCKSSADAQGPISDRERQKLLKAVALYTSTLKLIQSDVGTIPTTSFDQPGHANNTGSAFFALAVLNNLAQAYRELGSFNESENVLRSILSHFLFLVDSSRIDPRNNFQQEEASEQAAVGRRSQLWRLSHDGTNEGAVDQIISVCFANVLQWLLCKEHTMPAAAA